MATNSGGYDPENNENQDKIKPRTHKTEHGVEVSDIGQIELGSKSKAGSSKAHPEEQLR